MAVAPSTLLTAAQALMLKLFMAMDIWGVSVAADMGNGFSLGLNYSSLDGSGRDYTSVWTEDHSDDGVVIGTDTGMSSWSGSTINVSADHVGIGMTYVVDALTLHANYGRYDLNVDGDKSSTSGHGVAVNYDLGGGATFMAGYGDSEHGASTYSIGLGLSF